MGPEKVHNLPVEVVFAASIQALKPGLRLAESAPGARPALPKALSPSLSERRRVLIKLSDLNLNQLSEATWNPNHMDKGMMARPRQSLFRHGLAENPVVRSVGEGTYEVLSVNQLLQVLGDLGSRDAPCVVGELNDAHARLLNQALNQIRDEDDLGRRAELLRQVLSSLTQEEVVGPLPETGESLRAMISLGQWDIASYLMAWQLSQADKLTHLQIQLTPISLKVVEKALAKPMPQAKVAKSVSPIVKGTALYLLYQEYPDSERVAMTVPGGVSGPVCRKPLTVSLAGGRKSDKGFLMSPCSQDGGHIRTFINYQLHDQLGSRRESGGGKDS